MQCINARVKTVISGKKLTDYMVYGQAREGMSKKVGIHFCRLLRSFGEKFG